MTPCSDAVAYIVLEDLAASIIRWRESRFEHSNMTNASSRYIGRPLFALFCLSPIETPDKWFQWSEPSGLPITVDLLSELQVTSLVEITLL
jgi:hypothetical protein